jgi:hypothetical protein
VSNEELIAEATKAADMIHRWAFGDDSELPDRSAVRFQMERMKDALEASVSLAADRDRATAERCASIAEHPTWHQLGRLNDVEHAVAVRIAAAIRAAYHESEARND